jgi:iron complex transport system permease protein
MSATIKWLVLLSAVLVLSMWGALGMGPGDIGPSQAWSILLGWEQVPSDGVWVIIRDLRLPRILIALLIGASIGAAGAITQGLFQNPLAEPSVLGVNMGAALLAVIGFVLGIDRLGLWVTPLLAGIGAACTLALLFMLAGWSKSTMSLLLSGIALSSLCSAVITMLLALHVERWELGLKVMSWLMGSFEGRSWPHLLWSSPPLIAGLALALALYRELDVLLLGNESAASIGVSLKRLRLVTLFCIALLVGTATAIVGVIGFIGLVVPHISRRLVGAAHGRMIPLSLMLGALLMLWVDTLSRSVSHVVLPPGVITSLLGAPFFLWLLYRHEKRPSP